MIAESQSASAARRYKKSGRGSLPNNATLSVNVFHGVISPSADQTVTVSVGSFTQSPNGTSVSYNPTSATVTIPAGSAVGNMTVTFGVSGAALPAGSSSGTVTITALLSNPSSGLKIAANANGGSNNSTTLSISGTCP